MNERMLCKQTMPSVTEMTAYCGNCGALFTRLNAWLSETFDTEQEIKFPYGNHYGWCIAHKKKKKLVCNIFPEDRSFTVMIRLSDAQYDRVFDHAQAYMQNYIDNKYPCGDGGWIHYRITCEEQLEDIKKLLDVKCAS